MQRTHCRSRALVVIGLLGTPLSVVGCRAPQPVASPAAGATVEEDLPSAPPADLVLIGGLVHTMDRTRPLATAVAIFDGKIAAVGDDAAMRARIGQQTKVIELEGRTVVPGLIDSHAHLFGLGARGAGVDLSHTKSIEEIKTRIAKAIAERPGSGWILGRGWDQNDWQGSKAFPTAKDLDVVSPDRPVLMGRIDGHAIWVNSAAMRAAGIGPQTRDPPGGKIVRAGAKPTGVLIDNAMQLVASHVPPPTIEELMERALSGQRQCLEAGLVELHDMGLEPQEIEALKRLDDRGELRLRVYAMIDGSSDALPALLAAGPSIPADPSKRLTVRGVKLVMDGALGSRGAALLASYSDDPKNAGLLLTEQGAFEARVRAAKARGFQVATHAIGDRANRIVLDVYERVFGRRSDQRPRVEHAQLLSLDDLQRFAQLGAIASMQPTHATSDMPWAEARVGSERIKGAYAWRSLLTSGATIAAGSDAPVEDISPIAGLYAAITRQDPRAASPSPWRAEERMTPYQALESFTTAGAYASFREDQAGVIREGFVADLTVLEVDPISARPEELYGSKVELTIIAGEVVHERPSAERRPAPKKPVPTDASVREPIDSGQPPLPTPTN